MAKIEMSPRLCNLVTELAGAYPSDPRNETVSRLTEELSPIEIAELFDHTFQLYRQAVDAEHETCLKTRPYGFKISISRETAQIGHIAEALISRIDAAGIKMTLAVRASAIDSYIAQWPHSKDQIHKYTSEMDGYYRFYTNQAWLNDKSKTAIHIVFLADIGQVSLCNHTGAFVSFDVRDTYLIKIED